MQTQILIGLFICHWLADYTHLSNAWMLNAKRLGKPLFPIFIHAAMHTMLMSLVLGWFIGFTNAWAYLVIFQWVTHFLIDTWKGKMNVWFPALQSPANKWHWIFSALTNYYTLWLLSECRYMQYRSLAGNVLHPYAVGLLTTALT